MTHKDVINLAVGCVLASSLPSDSKRCVATHLRVMEDMGSTEKDYCERLAVEALKYNDLIVGLEDDLELQLMDDDDSAFSAGWNSCLDAIGHKLRALTGDAE